MNGGGTAADVGAMGLGSPVLEMLQAARTGLRDLRADDKRGHWRSVLRWHCRLR